jgi:hypothetical protein
MKSKIRRKERRRRMKGMKRWDREDDNKRKAKHTAVGIHCTEHVTPSIRKSWD